MLEGDYQKLLSAVLGRVKCGVVLPPRWGDFFERRGVTPTVENDRRRHPRLYHRTTAIVEVRQTLPGIERPHQFYAVFTKDISRGGMAFLHIEQLFPGERVVLWLPAGKTTAVVARCQRHNDRCYEIGVRFVGRGK